MQALVDEQLEAGVLTLTLQRPEHLNALDSDLCDALAAAMERAERNDEARVVILRGAGRAFCVGGDVKGMGAIHCTVANLSEQTQRLRRRMEAARRLHTMAKPTVAVVQGAAAGAGLSLALACDFRIASSAASFVTAFAGVALPGDYGGSYFLSRIVGSAKAQELYLLSPKLSAQQAQALGMVTQVVEPDALDGAAQSFASQLAHGPALAYRAIKSNMLLAAHADLQTCLDQEAALHVQCALSDDHREGVSAFVGKRAARFEGR